MTLKNKIVSVLAALSFTIESANAFDLESKIESLLQVKDQEKGEEIIQEIAYFHPKEEAFLFNRTKKIWHRITENSYENSVSYNLPSISSGDEVVDYHTHPKGKLYQKTLELFNTGIKSMEIGGETFDVNDNFKNRLLDWSKWYDYCAEPSPEDIADAAILKSRLGGRVALIESKAASPSCIWSFRYQKPLYDAYREFTKDPSPCLSCISPQAYYQIVYREVGKQAEEVFWDVRREVGRGFTIDGKENLAGLFQEAYDKYPGFGVKLTVKGISISEVGK